MYEAKRQGRDRVERARAHAEPNPSPALDV
jgi:hypothetical protein